MADERVQSWDLPAFIQLNTSFWLKVGLRFLTVACSSLCTCIRSLDLPVGSAMICIQQSSPFSITVQSASSRSRSSSRHDDMHMYRHDHAWRHDHDLGNTGGVVPGTRAPQLAGCMQENPISIFTLQSYRYLRKEIFGPSLPVFPYCIDCKVPWLAWAREDRFLFLFFFSACVSVSLLNL